MLKCRYISHIAQTYTFFPEGDVTTLEFFKLETLAIPPAKESGRMSAEMIFRMSIFFWYGEYQKFKNKAYFPNLEKRRPIPAKTS